MILDLLGTALIDGAGAKVKRNSDKKKLQEAEGDPEKTEQILADIKKREDKGNRLKHYMHVLALFVAIVAN